MNDDLHEWVMIRNPNPVDADWNTWTCVRCNCKILKYKGNAPSRTSVRIALSYNKSEFTNLTCSEYKVWSVLDG